MVKLTRYSENNAVTYNTAFQSLEDLYLRAGNAIEIITSETLTSSTPVIDLSLNGVTWRWLRLRFAVESNPAGLIMLLEANHKAGTQGGCYGTAGTTATGTSSGPNIFIGSTSSSGSGLNFGEITIFPNATGLASIGTCGLYDPPNELSLFMAGVWADSAPTSIQMILSTGGAVFLPGGAYILEGVRA